MDMRIINQSTGYVRAFISIFILLGLMSGCAATGSSYSKHVSEAHALEQNKSRLVLFRTRENSQYAGRAVAIKLNGEALGSCDYAGFNVFDIAAGKHILSVDIWDSPGVCNLDIEVNGGNEYYYEVSPRSGNLLGALLGGLIGTAIESSGKKCGGAFSIESITKEVANTKLTDLKMTQ